MSLEKLKTQLEARRIPPGTSLTESNAALEAIRELEAKLARADEEITQSYLAGRQEGEESAKAELEEVDRFRKNAGLAIVIAQERIEQFEAELAEEKRANGVWGGKWSAQVEARIAAERERDEALKSLAESESLTREWIAAHSAAESLAERYRLALEEIVNTRNVGAFTVARVALRGE